MKISLLFIFSFILNFHSFFNYIIGIDMGSEFYKVIFHLLRLFLLKLINLFKLLRIFKQKEKQKLHYHLEMRKDHMEQMLLPKGQKILIKPLLIYMSF